MKVPTWLKYPDWMRAGAFVMSMLAVLVCILIYTEVRPESEARLQLGQQNNSILKQVRNLTNDINDCIQPAGKCAQRGASARVGSATAITFCSITLPPDAKRDEVMQCIIDNLESKGG